MALLVACVVFDTAGLQQQQFMLEWLQRQPQLMKLMPTCLHKTT